MFGFCTNLGQNVSSLLYDEKRNNHYFNMVRLRKILLAESRGSSRFFNNKVVSDFDFGHFLKKSI